MINHCDCGHYRDHSAIIVIIMITMINHCDYDDYCVYDRSYHCGFDHYCDHNNYCDCNNHCIDDYDYDCDYDDYHNYCNRGPDYNDKALALSAIVPPLVL